MPVAMSEPNTQVLPEIPTVEEMRTWKRAELFQWIQQRSGDILEGDDLYNFNKACMKGVGFLRSSYKVFHEDCHLSVGASLGLEELVDEVKSKFIPWT